MDFAEFDKAFDVAGLKNDIRKAEENGTDYEEIPVGEYEVKIEKMELKASKKGEPMFSCWFKILVGDYKNHLIFMNQLLKEGFHFHLVNQFLRSLETEKEIVFDSFKQYGELIYDIKEFIDIKGYEFALDYQKKDGKYSTFKIVEVFKVPFDN
jgi:hypothetical protein